MGSIEIIPTEAARVADYVRCEGSCEPGTPVLVDDQKPRVWRVPVVSFNPSWSVPPPRFWYVCSYHGGLNLYRDDHQRPAPWLPLEEQEDASVIDYVRSFHVGLVTRMMGDAEAPDAGREG